MQSLLASANGTLEKCGTEPRISRVRADACQRAVHAVVRLAEQRDLHVRQARELIEAEPLADHRLVAAHDADAGMVVDGLAAATDWQRGYAGETEFGPPDLAVLT